MFGGRKIPRVCLQKNGDSSGPACDRFLISAAEIYLGWAKALKRFDLSFFRWAVLVFLLVYLILSGFWTAVALQHETTGKMGKGNSFFKNRRVYLLTTVAYLGSFLFGQ